MRAGENRHPIERDLPPEAAHHEEKTAPEIAEVDPPAGQQGFGFDGHPGHILMHKQFCSATAWLPTLRQSHQMNLKTLTM